MLGVWVYLYDAVIEFNVYFKTGKKTEEVIDGKSEDGKCGVMMCARQGEPSAYTFSPLT